MADKKEREEEKETAKDDDNDFTQMPDAEYPDMEPEQSAEKQVEQFNKTANTGKGESAEK